MSLLSSLFSKETCPKDSKLSGKPAPLSVLRWTLLPQRRFSEVPVWQQLLLSFKLRPPGSTTTTPPNQKRGGGEDATVCESGATQLRTALLREEEAGEALLASVLAGIAGQMQRHPQPRPVP